jgi:signal transduction histidine kinase
VDSTSTPPSSRPSRPAAVDAARFIVGARLVDSLLHEARNPLNALSINLGILSQKLKAPGGEVPPAQEKNLRAMREQLSRVDDILRLFADFIAPKIGPTPEVDFSALVQRACEVLGHEGRQHRVSVRVDIQPGIRLRSAETGLEFLALLPLLRAIARAQGGGEAQISLSRTADKAVLAVTDSAGDVPEPIPESLPALELLCREHEGLLQIRAGELRVELPAR